MVPPIAIQIVWLSFAIIFGAVVGSFLNVCIYRLPWEKSLVWPNSHCPHCLRPVRAYDNIPILSWFILRGRCRHCGEPFSARYMLIEVLTAVLFGVTLWLTAPAGIGDILRCGFYLFLLAALVVATFIDLDLQIIPDSVTVPGMVVGLCASTLIPDVPLVLVTQPAPGLPMAVADKVIYTADILAGWAMCSWGLIWLLQSRDDRPGAAEWVLWSAGALFLLGHTLSLLVAWSIVGQAWPGWLVWFGQHLHWQGFSTGVIGLLTGAGLIWTVRIIGSAAMGREAMGFGDVTLMAMVGAFLGWQAAICIFFMAPFMGLTIGIFQWVFRGNNILPYGPYLSLATLVSLWCWPSIWPVLAPRLAIFPLIGMFWGGIAILALLCILLLCVRIIRRQNQA